MTFLEEATADRKCSLSMDYFTKMTNHRLVNLLLVIDRLFIQMNADYRGGFSMVQPVSARNE